ncbi:MAG: hypothetical protein ACOYMA_22295 [Bacteroidia bacterium]
MNFSKTEFYKELEHSLPTSTSHKRKLWVNKIIEEDIDIKNLANLLKCEPKIATRFQWLLSEIGLASPNKLLAELPFLLIFFDQLNPKHKTSLASYWHIAGVPLENEGVAIDWLFQWLLSNHVNMTIKSRCILVLFKLTKKYPELKNELALCLKDQQHKYSKDFEKRVTKILNKLEE